jgi:uncharacterized protein (DUF362 family)
MGVYPAHCTNRELHKMFSLKILMDAAQGFSKGGPGQGVLIKPGLLLAGEDGVAIDAL